MRSNQISMYNVKSTKEYRYIGKHFRLKMTIEIVSKLPEWKENRSNCTSYCVLRVRHQFDITDAWCAAGYKGILGYFHFCRLSNLLLMSKKIERRETRVQMVWVSNRMTIRRYPLEPHIATSEPEPMNRFVLRYVESQVRIRKYKGPTTKELSLTRVSKFLNKFYASEYEKETVV